MLQINHEILKEINFLKLLLLLKHIVSYDELFSQTVMTYFTGHQHRKSFYLLKKKNCMYVH